MGPGTGGVAGRGQRVGEHQPVPARGGCGKGEAVGEDHRPRELGIEDLGRRGPGVEDEESVGDPVPGVVVAAEVHPVGQLRGDLGGEARGVVGIGAGVDPVAGVAGSLLGVPGAGVVGDHGGGEVHPNLHPPPGGRAPVAGQVAGLPAVEPGGQLARGSAQVGVLGEADRDHQEPVDGVGGGGGEAEELQAGGAGARGGGRRTAHPPGGIGETTGHRRTAGAWVNPARGREDRGRAAPATQSAVATARETVRSGHPASHRPVPTPTRWWREAWKSHRRRRGSPPATC